MAAVTSLGVTYNTTAANKTVTATPAVGDLIVIVCSNSGRAANQFPSIADDNAGGQSAYTQVASATKATNVDSMWIFVRNSLIRSGTSTIFTFSPSGGGDSGGGLDVLKVTGMAMGGNNAVRQSATQDNQAAAGTPAPAFAVAALTANPVIGAVMNATSPATMTPRASFTERQDVGYSVPTTGMETMSRDSGETGTTQTWGGTSASAFCSIVIELSIIVPFIEVGMAPMMGY